MIEKTTVTSWQDKNGNEVLRKKGIGKYYTPCGTMTLDELHDLQEACLEACIEADKEYNNPEAM